MKVSRLFLAALLTALASSAFGQDVRFVSTRASPLERAGTINVNETVFTGTIQINGSFEITWEPGSDGYPSYYRIVLMPDNESQEILPYDSQRGPVREIWLRNTETALAAMLSPQEQKALRASRTRTATGDVTAILNSYRTGVDCDQRGYNALLIKLIQPPMNIAVNAPTNESTGGC